MTAFIDVNVVMYAAGAEHPLRAPCRAVIAAIGERSLNAVTSVEVVQEVLHRYLAIGRRQDGVALAERTMNLFAPVLPISHALMRRVPDLAARYPSLTARDLIHLASCIHEGIPEIISTDHGFDAVGEVRRIDPLVFGA